MKFVPSTRLFVVALLATAMAACAPAAPPDTTAEDLAAIDALRTAWETAYEAGDAAALAALYTEDAVSMPMGEPTVSGRAAIEARFEAMFAEMTFGADIRPQATEVSGDWGFDTGEFSGSATPNAGGDAMTVEGRYLVVLQRDADGSWRIARDVDNSPTPPPAPEGGS